jgi:hypothetical protein
MVTVTLQLAYTEAFAEPLSADIRLRSIPGIALAHAFSFSMVASCFALKTDWSKAVSFAGVPTMDWQIFSWHTFTMDWQMYEHTFSLASSKRASDRSNVE